MYHTLEIQARFTFGDKVSFDSQLQECSGAGTIFGITVDRDMFVTYMIAIDYDSYDELQPGILENEMTLDESAPVSMMPKTGLSSDQQSAHEADTHTLIFQTRFTFNDKVRFDSQLQKCRGSGVIFDISLDRQGLILYTILLDSGDNGALQPGILDNEMTLDEKV